MKKRVPINMPTKTHVRTYLPATREALELMGLEIAAARKARKWSETTLAERAGISRSSVQRIEKGSPKAEVGMVFELASLLGIPLFGNDRRARLVSAREKAPLLPQRIRTGKPKVSDEF